MRLADSLLTVAQLGVRFGRAAIEERATCAETEVNSYLNCRELAASSQVSGSAGLYKLFTAFLTFRRQIFDVCQL